MIPFLFKHWQTALLVGAVLALVGMCRARDNALIEKGRAKAELANVKQEVALLKARADSLTNAFRVDTVRLTRTVTRYESLRDTLRLTDTIRVRETLRAADSAIQGCRLTLQTCSRLVAVRDSIAAKTDSIYQRREREIKKEFTVEKRTYAVVGILIGVAAGLFFAR
jgi:hypothetical protein